MSFSAGGWKRGLQRSLPTELLYNFITEISCYRMKSDYCKKTQICFNDIALYYCKAEKASLKNLRVRKYNTQFYTAPSISTDDNCTKYVHEDQCLDRKILFLLNNVKGLQYLYYSVVIIFMYVLIEEIHYSRATCDSANNWQCLRIL